MKYSIYILSFLSITNLYCDGILIVRGSVIEQSASDEVSIVSSKFVDSVKVIFFPFVKQNGMISSNIKKECLTDHKGFFKINQTVPPNGNQNGLLVAEKEGYHSDSVYFEYKSFDTLSFTIKIEANKK